MRVLNAQPPAAPSKFEGAGPTLDPAKTSWLAHPWRCATVALLPARSDLVGVLPFASLLLLFDAMSTVAGGWSTLDAMR
ncbi:MAG: hypothetical protein DMG35_00430 [Acidobacteria bacterium]|nr:MAG: hypothetical protein AUH86_09220 [Acidobacteria bacterium 13_1_40CM_4_58_4]PYT64442.1 MAG: hypothetical protein DMG35_00430 [Acidobacteriota bacterium]